MQRAECMRHKTKSKGERPEKYEWEKKSNIKPKALRYTGGVLIY